MTPSSEIVFCLVILSEKIFVREVRHFVPEKPLVSISLTLQIFCVKH